MSVTGNPDGTPGGGPQKVGVAVADLMTGMYAVSAILGALYERTRSSLGQHIDLALLDTQVAWLCNQNMNYLLSGKPPVRQGSQHPNIVPYGSFATKDGHLMLAIGNDRQFASFMQHAGRPDVAADARYQTNTGRLQHREDVLAIVSTVLSTRTTREWLDTLTPAAVPCGPINNLAEVFAEPQVQHRHLLMQLTNSQGVSVPQVRNPIVYSRSELSYRRAPPALGEHSDSVLACELGLDAPALAALRARGVIE
jgi:crotonobetainyl-CoA:carnitine CoA-transferase CaiB-like acyl-CoA transferase